MISHSLFRWDQVLMKLSSTSNMPSTPWMGKEPRIEVVWEVSRWKRGRFLFRKGLYYGWPIVLPPHLCGVGGHASCPQRRYMNISNACLFQHCNLCTQPFHPLARPQAQHQLVLAQRVDLMNMRGAVRWSRFADPLSGPSRTDQTSSSAKSLAHSEYLPTFKTVFLSHSPL